MHEIEFICRQCGQHLLSTGDAAGLMVECPACRNVIEVPEKSDAPERRTSPSAAGGNPTSKSSTARIDLPPNLGLPPVAPPRRIVIRRRS